MKIVALYSYSQGISYLGTIKFETDRDADKFQLALQLVGMLADPNSDTATFLASFKLPEQLSEIQKFDEDARYTKNNRFISGIKISTYDKKNLLRSKKILSKLIK